MKWRKRAEKPPTRRVCRVLELPNGVSLDLRFPSGSTWVFYHGQHQGQALWSGQWVDATGYVLLHLPMQPRKTTLKAMEAGFEAEFVHALEAALAGEVFNSFFAWVEQLYSNRPEPIEYGGREYLAWPEELGHELFWPSDVAKH